MMHERGKSDPVVVAVKPANKAERSAAELAEPRAGTKRNAGQQSTDRTPSRATVTQALDRIRRTARERKKERFTALLHHIDTDLLEAEFFALKVQAAAGVDGVTWRDYEHNLKANLRTCTLVSIGARIGRCRHGGCISQSQTDGSAR
jgi:hypothetical protein